MKQRLGAIALAAALTSVAVGCSGSPADDGEMDVIVSFSALEFVAERVAGDGAHITNLTPEGADPHSAELPLAAIAELQEADLIVYLSGLQPSTDDAVGQVDGVRTVDTAEAARAAVPGATAADGGPDAGLDPHFWLDPMRLALAGHQVADALAELDPDQAAQYRDRAAALEAELVDLDREFADALEPCAGATLVTSHEAFGYLAARYDLNQVGIAGVDPEVEPSPARLREISDIVARSGVQTIYFEVNASPKVAETLADELGVETDVLDPMERPRDADYMAVMRDNLDALTRGLACVG